MRILVLVKITAQPLFADTLKEQAARLAAGRLMLNPPDQYALEMALRIKDRKPDTAVTVLCMAPKSCETELREALAMGADEAVLIADPQLAGSDTLVTARVLAAAVRLLPPPDLILCGKKSIDSETGHIGPQLAALLQLPLAADTIRFSVEDGLEVQCLRDRSVRTYRGTLPALLTLRHGTEPPRRPTIGGIRKSRDKTVRILTAHELGLSPEETGSAGSPTRVEGMTRFEPKAKDGLRIKDIGEGVRTLSSWIRAEGEGPV